MAANIFVLLVVVYSIINDGVDTSSDVLKTMTITFTKALDACKEEMDIPDSVDIDFINFWKQDHVVTHRNMGCVVMCLASKLDLVDHRGILVHGNGHAFAKQHGADDAKAQQLVDMIYNCEQKVGDMEDECLRAVAVMNCFKADIHTLSWTPSMDLIVGEILTEI